MLKETMLENIKAVIFDMDGTLIDSMWMWGQIDIEYLAQFGLELPDDLHGVIEGMSFSETALYFKGRFQIEHTVEQMKNDWNRMAWAKYEKEVFLKAGVQEFLDELKNRNIKMGIATSNSPELVKLIIEVLDIESYFQSIHTSCEVERGKPFPDIYELVAKDLDVSPSDCLVFEDVVQGIMAGKNAGMKVCAVYDEFSHPFDEEKIKLADYYIHDFIDFK